MHDAHGVGLAATQVGVLRRVFVFQPHEDDEPRAVVNPAITERSEETAATKRAASRSRASASRSSAT